MKVVFHVDELAKWRETSSNVRNLLKAASDIEIVVLVNGIAITGYLLAENADFINTTGISFHACNNAMLANQVAPEDLPVSVQVVPAGVLDLVELQQKGFAYIKP